MLKYLFYQNNLKVTKAMFSYLTVFNNLTLNSRRIRQYICVPKVV